MSMNFILRLFLTFSSVSYFIVVFLVQNEIFLSANSTLKYKWSISLAYLFVPVVLSVFSLVLCKALSKSSLNKILSIETSNNDFLSNYLAYFFVALSVKDNEIIFWVVFGLTVLFTFFSRVSYFNPMFLVFGYNFYYVHTQENVKIMLICRKKLRNPQSFEAMQVRRINDYTYIGV